MNTMRIDEMQILKCTVAKVTDDTLAFFTYQYHTEHDPETGKVDRSKSRYRWLTRVAKVDDIKAEIQNMLQDNVALTPWTWPNDPTWNGKMFTNDSTQKRGAEWLNVKLKKAMPWDDAIKQLKGWQKSKNAYNPGAAYITEGYSDVTGNSNLSILDKDVLLAHLGQNLWIDKFFEKQIAEQPKENAVA